MHGRSALDLWQEKSRCFRKLAKRWSANLEAGIRKHKKELVEEYDSLGSMAENHTLSYAESGRLDHILRE
jgi:hypothetical protein